MEDFGYRKNDEQTAGAQLAKRIFLVCATLFSIACFVYVTVNAYYYVYEERNGDIETIKSPEGPIKVLETDQNAVPENGIQIDRTIYEDIFGNKNGLKKTENAKLRGNLEAPIPPKNLAEQNKNQAQFAESNAAPIKLDEPLKPAQALPRQAQDPNQKIIVFSDKAVAQPAKDLLTKKSGDEKSSAQASAGAPAQAPKKRAVRVQVAAMTSKDAAEENWDRLQRLYSSLFSGLKPFVEEVNLGKRGMFYRLQIGNFYNQVEAEEFCSRYVAQAKKSRADCIVVE